MSDQSSSSSALPKKEEELGNEALVADVTAGNAPRQNICEVPVPGMKSTPLYFNTYKWDLMGGFWAGLCSYLITEKDARLAFEEATGLSVEGLVARSPLDAMIDKATGYEATVIAAWCDWVTVNHWGVA